MTVPAGGGRFTINVPVATNIDGSTIAGQALEEFVVDDAVTVTGPLTYPAATSDKSQAMLTVRTRYEDPPVPVPVSGWDYTNAGLTAVQLLPSGTPFQRGALYEFTYVATNPLIAGLGFAAIRDLAAFLHNATADDRGNPNPLVVTSKTCTRIASHSHAALCTISFGSASIRTKAGSVSLMGFSIGSGAAAVSS